MALAEPAIARRREVNGKRCMMGVVVGLDLGFWDSEEMRPAEGRGRRNLGMKGI
jgi:hypothetical protein